jgi:predicted NBD/HSP70 family sugar kinase
LTAKEIALAAAGGDRCAQECLTVYQDRLARSLAAVINLLDPDVIVLGGGLSNMVQRDLPPLSGITLFLMASTHPSCARLTVTRAECGVPPGFGRPPPPRERQGNRVTKDQADADYLSRANMPAQAFIPPFDLMKAVSG